MREATKAELARLVGAHRSTVGRALAGDPAAPPPTNPGQPQERFPVEEFLSWWPNRRPMGRPRKTAPSPRTRGGDSPQQASEADQR